MHTHTKTTQLAGRALREPDDRSADHGVLFERVADRLYRFFVKMVWDVDTAEELAQRTLLLLERSLRVQAYDPERSFNTWMWLKAHTVFAQWCRERSRRPARLSAEEEASLPGGSSHETDVDRRLDATTVLRAVQLRLGAETYEILCLHYEGGLTYTEIGATIGCDRRTVASRLREAHTLIRSLLEGKR